jgi:hypothetical protein
MSKKYMVEEYNEHYDAYDFIGMFDTLEEAEHCLENLEDGIIVVVREEDE